MTSQKGSEMRLLFDRMADDYDQLVNEADRDNRFPFAGYDEMMAMIAEYLLADKSLDPVKVLDLGIGTGSLYRKLPPERLRLFGCDFSEKMLERTRLLHPAAKLELHDFSLGIPESFRSEKFDFIVATYAFHHLRTRELVGMIAHLLMFLEPLGKIIIGDVLFTDEAEP